MLQLTTAPTSKALTKAANTEVGGIPMQRMAHLVLQASAVCEAYCGRPFGLATWTETFFHAAYPLVLSRLPVVAVTWVTENGAALNPASDFMIDTEAGIIHRMGWPAPCGSITVAVVYQAGYVLPTAPSAQYDQTRTLPSDIERACLEVVKALWFSGGDSARDPAVRSDSVEGVGSTSYLDPNPNTGGLPMLAATLLEPYRRVGL